MMRAPMRVGIDLDNTIIDYDQAFTTAARQRGLVDAGFIGGKQQLRDYLRTLAGGEQQWMALQGYVYGKGIGHAKLYDGALNFITKAKSQRHSLTIVSHKTLHGHYDAEQVNLREAALGFLHDHKVIGPIAAEDIFFDETRAGKVAKIAELKLDVFIDDLPEVFEEPGFPENTQKILFGAPDPIGKNHRVTVLGSWHDIINQLL